MKKRRDYIKQRGVGGKRGKRGTTGPDKRKREMAIFSAGQIHKVIVGDFRYASQVGRYMSVVGKFLETNDPSVLKRFKDESFLDVKGRRYVFETRPNVLYRLISTQTETFEDVYRIVG